MAQQSKGTLKPFVDRVFRGKTKTREELGLIAARMAEIERLLTLTNRKLQNATAALNAVGDRAERIEVAQTATAQAVAELRKSGNAVLASINALKEDFEKTAGNEFRQREALDALSKLLDLDRPLPPTRAWAGSPDFLLHLHQHIGERRPRTVVELGSGVSTIVAAAALRSNGEGLLHSLDHLAEFGDETSRQLRRQRLDGVAAVHFAPLASWRPPRPTPLGEAWQWYGVPEALASVGPIDLLIVDGPPLSTGPNARYPAVPHFHAQMAPGCVVLLDDAMRPDERAACEAWQSEWAMRCAYRHEFEKGLAILTAEDRPSGGSQPAQSGV